MIKIWKFDDAPAEYRDLSIDGGDEDWLAFVPLAMEEEYFVRITFQAGSVFGPGSSRRYSVEGGVVYIGAH